MGDRQPQAMEATPRGMDRGDDDDDDDNDDDKGDTDDDENDDDADADADDDTNDADDDDDGNFCSFICRLIPHTCEACGAELQGRSSFVYVTMNGLPPEMKSPPFVQLDMLTIHIMAAPTVLMCFCAVPGVVAVEFKRPRGAGPWRVRLYHPKDHRPRCEEVEALQQVRYVLEDPLLNIPCAMHDATHG